MRDRIVAAALLLPLAACGVRHATSSGGASKHGPTKDTPGLVVHPSTVQPDKDHRSKCICLEQAMGTRPLSVDGSGRYLKPTTGKYAPGADDQPPTTYTAADGSQQPYLDAEGRLPNYTILGVNVISTPKEHHNQDYFWTEEWVSVTADFSEDAGTGTVVVQGSYNLLDAQEIRPLRAIAITYYPDFPDGTIPSSLPEDIEEVLIRQAVNSWETKQSVADVTHDDFPPDSDAPSTDSGQTDSNGNPCTPDTCPVSALPKIFQHGPEPLLNGLTSGLFKGGGAPAPHPLDNGAWSAFMFAAPFLASWLLSGTCVLSPVAIFNDTYNAYYHFRRAVHGPFNPNPPGSQLTEAQNRAGQIVGELIEGFFSWAWMFYDWFRAKASCTAAQTALQPALATPPPANAIAAWLNAWITFVQGLNWKIVITTQVIVLGYLWAWVGIEQLYNMIFGFQPCVANENARPDNAPEAYTATGVTMSRDPATGRLQVNIAGTFLQFVTQVTIQDRTKMKEYTMNMPINAENSCNALWFVMPDASAVPDGEQMANGPQPGDQFAIILTGQIPGFGAWELPRDDAQGNVIGGVLNGPFVNDVNQAGPQQPQGPCGSAGILPLGGPGGGGPGFGP